MTNYANGKIYEIVCNITGERYIGSTTKELSKRLLGHKSMKDCKSIQIIEKGNYYINLLDTYSCNNKDELRLKEREWFDKIENINKSKPYISIEERKEYKKEYHKEWGKEKITCICGSIICKDYKSKHEKTLKHQEFLSNNIL